MHKEGPIIEKEATQVNEVPSSTMENTVLHTVTVGHLQPDVLFFFLKKKEIQVFYINSGKYYLNICFRKKAEWEICLEKAKSILFI